MLNHTRNELWPCLQRSISPQRKPEIPTVLQSLQRKQPETVRIICHKSALGNPCVHHYAYRNYDYLQVQSVSYHSGEGHRYIISKVKNLMQLPKQVNRHGKKCASETLNPLWMSCSLTSLPSSSAPKPADALISWTKVNLSGFIPSCCICWKSCITSSGCPSFTYFVSFLFHENLFTCTVPSAIAAISDATHGGSPWSWSESVSSSVRNPDTFHLSTIRNADQAGQPGILHIPCINAIIRTEKSHTDLHHQREIDTTGCIY